MRRQGRDTSASAVPSAALAAALAAVILGAGGAGCSSSADGAQAPGKSSDASSVSLGNGAPRMRSASPFPLSDDDRPKNLVLLLGDGMGTAHVLATRALTNGMGRPLAMERLPVSGLQTTQSLDEIVTDSASAATSLATGRKVPQRVISEEDGRPLETFVQLAARSGMAVGFVTDSYLWDATPSAFLAHAPSRYEYRSIVEQVARGPAVVAFGTRAEPGWHPDRPSPDAASIFGAEGWDVFVDWEELAARHPATLDRAVALLPTGSIADPRLAPSLAELTEIALARLSRDPQGFFLLVETEETDIASHARDIDRVARAVSALDGAVKVATAHPSSVAGETLVVVTADHECGGLALVAGKDGEPLEVRWSGEHTAAPVPVYASGPGDRRFAGVRDNTELARIFAELLGVRLP